MHREFTDEQRELIKDLHGVNCRGCDGNKPPGKSFCGNCYRRLPKHLRNDLYILVGAGYEEAFRSACHVLGVDRGEGRAA
jgi:hypothetical protein